MLVLWLMACVPGADSDTDPVGTDADTDIGSDIDTSVGTDGDSDPDSDTDPSTPTYPDVSVAGPVPFTSATTTVGTGGDQISVTVITPPTPGNVVIFSPGFQLGAAQYTSYAEHVASWGYTAYLVDYPTGSFLSPRTHAQLAADLGRVIDGIGTVLPGAPGGVVAVGHSAGGKVSLLRAATDSRIDGVFALDPVDALPPTVFSPNADYPSVTPELMGDIDVPLVLLGERTNSQGGLLTPACAPAADNFDAYFDEASGPAVRVHFPTAFHMSWVDDPQCLVCLACPAGTDNPAQTRALSRTALVAFADGVFGNPLGYGAMMDILEDAEAAGRVQVDEANGGL